MFNNKELKLAQYFMERASEEFGRNICNDIDDVVWENWTVEERRKFVKDYHDWNGDPEDYDEEELHLPDFAIISFLSYRLEKISSCNFTHEELYSFLMNLNSRLSRQLDGASWYNISTAIIDFMKKKNGE